jgi:hypothetical protein
MVATEAPTRSVWLFARDQRVLDRVNVKPLTANFCVKCIVCRNVSDITLQMVFKLNSQMELRFESAFVFLCNEHEKVEKLSTVAPYHHNCYWDSASNKVYDNVDPGSITEIG